MIMAKSRPLTERENLIKNDFDPENDVHISEEEDSRSEDSCHDITRIDNYAQLDKSKLRRPTEFTLGPKYSGTETSRHALQLEEDYTDEDSSNDDLDNTGSEDSTDSNNSKPKSKVGDSNIDSDEAFTETDTQISTDDSSQVSEEPMRISGSQNKSHIAAPPFNKQNKKKKKEMNHPGRDKIENYPSIDAQKLTESERSSDSDDIDSDSDKKRNNNHENDMRSELQKIMREDHQTVMSKITQAAKADVEKGKAVNAQRLIFDSLLNVRISLQKALIATNSMAVSEFKNTNQATNKQYDAAEDAAVKLWNRLDDFLHKMIEANSSNRMNLKRKSDMDLTTSSLAICNRMKILDAASIDHRKNILEKWSSKVTGTITVPISEKFRPPAQKNLTSVTLDQLANSEQLVRRTKIPRSCAPIQRELKILEDPNIYDDEDFYRDLLKEMLEQRRAESFHLPVPGSGDNKFVDWTAIKETKTRKVMDTRASKGRKMRFTIHEKLQNFAAPQDRSSWEQTAIDRLFGSLLGQKIVLNESEHNNQEYYSEPEEESLRLFRT